MDKGKALLTHDPSSDSSSSEDGGLVIRGHREQLNMPRFPVASTRGQVEADRELAKKLEEEERLRRPGLMEIPGDEEFTLRL